MLALLLAALSGALLAGSLPPLDQGWLCWFALVPVLVACRARRPLEAAGLGIVSGLACGLIHLIRGGTITFTGFGPLPFRCLAVFIGVVCFLSVLARRRWNGLAWVAFLACTALTLEWLSAFGPLPLHLALSQYRTLPLLQLASLTGVWGISLLLWWSNTALADLLLDHYSRGEPTPHSVPGSRARLAPLGAVIAVAALAWVGGALALRSGPASQKLRVAAIQDYAPEEGSRFTASTSPSREPADREALTREAVARGAQFVVWSELALGSSFHGEAVDDPTTSLARELHTPLVAGYLEPTSTTQYNCASLIDSTGSVVGTHRKVHLFLGEVRNTSAGTAARVVPASFGKLGIEICFDTCYTDISRHLANQGARLVAMPNFDPPTPGGIVHWLHTAFLTLRAAETGMPIVRADPSGLSQVIDSQGRILAQAPLWQAYALVAEVPLGTGTGTPFSRSGDWLAYLAVLVTAGFAVAAPFHRKRFGVEGAGWVTIGRELPPDPHTGRPPTPPN